MGYTHYWKTGRDISKAAWKQIIAHTQIVIRHCRENGIPLAYESDEPNVDVVLSGNFIRFNGVGNNGHETFVFTREKCSFQFCKTAHKPYDIAVCLVLLICHQFSSNVVASSDGDAGDWKQAIELFRKLFGTEPKRPVVR
jgi:hypothetical protein